MPFTPQDRWYAIHSTMGFQSLVYDQNNKLIASVEPTDPNSVGPSQREIAELIAGAPELLKILKLLAHMPDQTAAKLLADYNDRALEVRMGNPLR